MKKTVILSILVLMLPCIYASAEDIVQILPVTTFAGATEDDEQYMEVQMVNDTYDEVGIVSFDLLLPEGITFLYEDFEGERVPFTKKGKNITYDFSLFEPTLQASGYTRYLLVPGGQIRPITDKSGTFMYLYFEVDADMAPGVYPILIQETVIGKSETEGLYPEPSVSYIVIKANEGDASPLQTEAKVDLSAMTGYVPSFVVETMNEELAQNESLVAVDLSGATELGAALEVPENVAWFTSNAGGLQRTFTEGQWSTVCLPFGLSEELVGELKAAGVEIEEMADYDEAANELNFTAVDRMEANKPYIVKCPADMLTPFALLAGTSADKTFVPVADESGNVTMSGTFETLTLNSGNGVTYFVFDAADGEFVRIGSNATVPPFRAYVALTSQTSSSRLLVRHPDGTTTGVSTVRQQVPLTQSTFNLLGQPADKHVKNTIIINNGRKMIAR